MSQLISEGRSLILSRRSPTDDVVKAARFCQLSPIQFCQLDCSPAQENS
ncbi:hypothetical protein H6G93_33915 [Nostoc sp. FACHB-973]|nr:hypothetical protein [Nostoc sp. FACHB-973]